MTKKMPAACAIIALFFNAAALFAAEAAISGSLNWVDMDIDAKISLNLRSLGVTLPTGRSAAEKQLFSEYFSNILPFIHSIPVDSSSILGNFLERGELAPETVENIALQADMMPPSISTDMQDITASYRISLSEICSTLIRHSRGADFMYIVEPQPVPVYTGIIIIADDMLPVHGRNSASYLTPCLFPKIWDTEMNLVFDKKFTDPGIFLESTMIHYMSGENIFMRTPSGLSAEIQKIVGDKPLRIIARGVFGINPTDPVIDSEDARIILSSEVNKRLLREGRVAIIASNSVLQQEWIQQALQ